MADERRQSRRVPVEMTAEVFITGRNGDPLCEPVKALVADLNGQGISLCLSEMWINGIHLFYKAHEDDECSVLLRFTDSKGRRYTLTCQPVWYNKEIDDEPMYYRLGLVFINHEEKDQIKVLQQLAKGREERGLSAILSNFFKKQLIRAS